MLRNVSPVLGERPANLRDFGAAAGEERGNNWQLKGEGQHRVLKVGGISVTLQRTRHMRNALFGADDYQYHLKFTPEPNSPKLDWEMTSRLLRAALVTVLEWMLSEFNPQDVVQTRLIEVNIGESGLGPNNSFLPTGTYDLTRVGIAELVDSCLRQVERCQNSNHTIALDERLLVYIKCLAIPVVKSRRAPYRPRNFGRKRAPAVFAGARTNLLQGMQLLRQGTSETEYNFLRIPDWFAPLKNYCLPASILVCHLYRQSLLRDYLGENAPEQVKRDAKTYSVVKGMAFADLENPKSANRAKKAALRLWDLVIAFLAEIGFPGEGPYEIESFCAAAAPRLNAQIRIYSSNGNRLEYCIPSSEGLGAGDMFSLRQFVLYKEEPVAPETVAHIQPVLKPHTFFKHSGYSCCFCEKHIYPQKSGGRHICRRGRIRRHTCLACDKLVPPQDLDRPVYADSSNADSFCLREGGLVIQCTECKATCHSAQCAKNHRAKCGKLAHCPKCGTFIQTRGLKPEEALEAHACGEATCKLCYTKYLKSDTAPHYCLLKPAIYQKSHDYCAFYDCESITTKDSSRSCEECALLRAQGGFEDLGVRESKNAKKRAEQAVKCDKHKDEGEEVEEGHHVPVFICLYFEKRGQRGHFSKVTFASSDMEHPEDCVLVDEAVYFPYIPEGMNELNLNLDGPKKAKKGIRGSAVPVKLQVEPGIEKTETASNRFIYESLAQLKALKNASAATKFIAFLCRLQFKNYSVFALNNRGYDGQLILREMMLQGITPRIDSTGSKLLCITIESHKIRFLDSLCYVQASADQLAKQYGLDTGGKLQFPIKMLDPQYYNETFKEWPGVEWFTLFSDSEQSIREKAAEVARRRADKSIFSFKEQLSLYCAHDTLILLKGMMSFLRQCYEVQHAMLQSLKPEIPAGVLPYQNPFTAPFFTFPSFCLNLWKIFCGRKATLYTFPETAVSRVNSSVGEMEFAAYIQSGLGTKVISKFTAEKPARFGPYTLDVYCPASRTAWEYAGCNFHLCSEPDCKYSPKEGENRERNVFGIPFEKMRRDREARNKYLREEHNIAKIIEMPECRWQEAKSADLSTLPPEKYAAYKDIQDFMKHKYQARPSERISIRDALRGGRSEAFGMSFEPETQVSAAGGTAGVAPAAAALASARAGQCPPGSSSATGNMQSDYYAQYLDKNGLYPFCATYGSPLYPTGPPIDLINQRDIEQIRIEDERFTFVDASGARRPFEGFVQCSLLAPRSLVYPFLPMRIGERSIVALCRTCAEGRLARPCAHTDEQRGWTGTYCTDELVHAVGLGYEITAIYECVAYTEFTPLFEDFFRLFLSYRMRNSGFPQGADTAEQRLSYCETMNRVLKFDNEYTRITPEMVTLNKAEQLFFKLVMNSLLGKFGQNNHRTEVKLINNRDELAAVYNRADYEIANWNFVGPTVMQLRVRKKAQFVALNRSAYLPIAAFTTSKARVLQDRDMRAALARGLIPYYTDTDSFVFLCKKSQPHGLPLSSFSGDYKDEMEGRRIVAFFALGSKNYTVIYLEEDQVTAGSIVHVRGFTLKSRFCSSVLNSELLGEFAISLLEGKPKSLKVVQFNLRTHSATRMINTRYMSKEYRNNFPLKRFIVPGSRFKLTQTLPFGFDAKMLADALAGN